MMHRHWYRELELLQVSRPPAMDGLVEVAAGEVLADLPEGASDALVGAGALPERRFEGARLAIARGDRTSSLVLDPALMPAVRLVRAPEGPVLEGDWGRLTHLELSVACWQTAAPAVTRWTLVRDAQASFAIPVPEPGGPRAWHELHVAGCLGEAQGPSIGAWIEPAGQTGAGTALPAGDAAARARRPGMAVALAGALVGLDEDPRTSALGDDLPIAVLAAWLPVLTGVTRREAPELALRLLTEPEVVLGARHHARHRAVVDALPAEAAPRALTTRGLLAAAVRERPALSAWVAEAPLPEAERALELLARRPELDALEWAVERLGAVPSADPDEMAGAERASRELALGPAIAWLERVAAGPGVSTWPAEDVGEPGPLLERAREASRRVAALAEVLGEPAGPALEPFLLDPAVAAGRARLDAGLERARRALEEARRGSAALAGVVDAVEEGLRVLAPASATLAVVRAPAALVAVARRRARDWRHGMTRSDASASIVTQLDELEARAAQAPADDAGAARLLALAAGVDGALRFTASTHFEQVLASTTELERELARLRPLHRALVRGPLWELIESEAWPRLAAGCPLRELVEVVLRRAEVFGRPDRVPALARLAALMPEDALAAEVVAADAASRELSALAADAARRHEVLAALEALGERLRARGGAADARLRWTAALMGEAERALERLGARAGALPPAPARRAGAEAALVEWLAQARGA